MFALRTDSERNICPLEFLSSNSNRLPSIATISTSSPFYPRSKVVFETSNYTDPFPGTKRRVSKKEDDLPTDIIPDENYKFASIERRKSSVSFYEEMLKRFESLVDTNY